MHTGAPDERVASHGQVEAAAFTARETVAGVTQPGPTLCDAELVTETRRLPKNAHYGNASVEIWPKQPQRNENSTGYAPTEKHTCSARPVQSAARKVASRFAHVSGRFLPIHPERPRSIRAGFRS
jgi:hypothetical protein